MAHVLRDPGLWLALLTRMGRGGIAIELSGLV